jgi:hypothetical protein
MARVRVQRDDPGLADVVGADEGHAHEPAPRRDVHNLARLLRDHDAADRLAELERPRQIDGQRVVPIRRRHLLGASPLHHSGVVDQNVDPAEAVLRGAGDHLNRGLVAQIGPVKDGVGRQVIGRRDINSQDLGAERHKAMRQRRADPAGAARDDHGLAGDVEQG